MDPLDLSVLTHLTTHSLPHFHPYLLKPFIFHMTTFLLLAMVMKLLVLLVFKIHFSSTASSSLRRPGCTSAWPWTSQSAGSPASPSSTPGLR